MSSIHDRAHSNRRPREAYRLSGRHRIRKDQRCKTRAGRARAGRRRPGADPGPDRRMVGTAPYGGREKGRIRHLYFRRRSWRLPAPRSRRRAPRRDVRRELRFRDLRYVPDDGIGANFILHRICGDYPPEEQGPPPPHHRRGAPFHAAGWRRFRRSRAGDASCRQQSGLAWTIPGPAHCPDITTAGKGAQGQPDSGPEPRCHAPARPAGPQGHFRLDCRSGGPGPRQRDHCLPAVPETGRGMGMEPAGRRAPPHQIPPAADVRQQQGAIRGRRERPGTRQGRYGCPPRPPHQPRGRAQGQ